MRDSIVVAGKTLHQTIPVSARILAGDARMQKNDRSSIYFFFVRVAALGIGNCASFPADVIMHIVDGSII